MLLKFAMQYNDSFVFKRELLWLLLLSVLIFGILIGLWVYEKHTGRVTAMAVSVGKQLIQR